MKSLLIRSFLAAIALFVWGFLYFGLAGIPMKMLGQVGDIGPALEAVLPESGTYFIPAGQDEEAMKLMERGPVATIHYHQGGVTPMSAMVMLSGFLHGWVVCIILGMLICCFASDKPTGKRLGFVLFVGLAGAIMTRIGDVIWWHYPLSWQLSNIFYHLVGFLIAGLVLGRLGPLAKEE